MNRLLHLAAALMLTAAVSAAHARVADCDPEVPTLACGYHPRPPSPPPAPPTGTADRAGSLYIFGTFNTLSTVAVVTPSSAQLCSPNLANCRPASGLDALRRGTAFAVAQLLRWDRSGVFAINASEIIACFSYFDSPSGALFTCASAPRNGLNGYPLWQAATALGWQAYGGAGLVPLNANRAVAKFNTRKQITAYVVANNGQLPPDRKRALFYETGGAGYDGGGGGGDLQTPVPPDMPPIELGEIVIIGNREGNEQEGGPPVGMPIVDFPDITNVGNQKDPPLVIINPCVSFAACAAPPPPPLQPADPNPPSKRICTPQCQANDATMTATCGTTSGQLAATFAVVTPTVGIIAGVFGDPAFGYGVFKAVGAIGGATTSAYTAACLAANKWATSQCLAAAKQNGC